jgi:hypothetical protein
MPTAERSRAAGPAGVAWLAWLAFVVYGSLLPFDWQPLPLAQALARFHDIPFLHLGVESRAD